VIVDFDHRFDVGDFIGQWKECLQRNLRERGKRKSGLSGPNLKTSWGRREGGEGSIVYRGKRGGGKTGSKTKGRIHRVVVVTTR